LAQGVIILRYKKLFYISIILFVVYIILSFPFLYENFPQANALVLVIPFISSGRPNFLGIIALILLAASLILISIALKKYQGRIVLAAIILAALVPQLLAVSYQKTFATGIYAISYEQEDSGCDITRTDEQTVLADCELILVNHGKDEVELSVAFYDNVNRGEHSVIDIVNYDAPYDVRLLGNERKTVTINTKVDLSKSENPIKGGSMEMMNIIIRSNGGERKL